MNGYVYYNELDPAAAAWLRQLIADGHLPAGDVDERSIEDVVPSDLHGYRQCHFFAGIGGWALALAIAGWPSDRPVWTGSCPCQPFSAAGARAGFADERHLWPAWQHLIAQCRPATIFGEQVASTAVGPWLDLVQADVEGMGYAFGSVAFPAASIGAPHIRDRTYWVADAIGDGSQGRLRGRSDSGRQVVDGSAGRVRADCGLADADGRNASAERQQCGGEQRQQQADGCAIDDGHASTTHGGWDAADWLRCRDGKWRPVEPGTFPLVDGLPRGVVRVGDPSAPINAARSAEGRVMRLRGYGNAIVPEQAAEFVRAFLSCATPIIQ